MPNLTSVGVTAGVPTSGTGTVSTIDNLIGTAGTATAQVLSVQGVASMTALKVDGSAVTQPVSLATNTPVIATGSNTIGSVKVTDGTNTSAVKAASTSPVATDPALVTSLSPNSAGIVTLGQTTKSSSVPVTIASDQGINDYPVGATAITASATGTTAATTATLAGAASKTTYLVGFSIRANATAAATGNATVTGTITGTLNFTQWTAALASGIGIVEPTITKPIPASGTNQAIAIISAAPGTGGTVSVSAWGYQL